MTSQNTIKCGSDPYFQLSQLTPSLVDRAKGFLSGDMFLVSFALGVAFSALLMLNLELATFAVLLMPSAAISCLFAHYGNAWMSGWSSSWSVVSRFSLDGYVYVVALDRIKRKRVFKGIGIYWNEVGVVEKLDPLLVIWLNVAMDQPIQKDA